MIYGLLINWITDCTVWGLTNWLNDLWLVDWLNNWLYCQGTDQLVDWPSNWVYCLETDQLTERFIAGWLTNYSVADSTFWELTNWLNDLWLVEWLNNSLYCRGLTNWLNDLWLVDWLNNWLYCQGTDQLVDWPSNWVYCLETDQLTERFIAGWLTNYSVADSTFWELTNWLNDLWLVEWLNNWL